jgi:hypothetical protein
MNKFLIVFGLVFFNLIIVSATPVLLSDQGTDIKVISTGNLVDGGNLTILIYESSSGGSAIYSKTFVNNITNGSWNVMINPDLEFGEFYWKDYEINSDNLNFSGNDRLRFQSPLGLINNVSLINFSLIDSCAAGSSIRQINENGSVICETDDSGGGGSQWSIAGSKYLYNNSGVLDVNETVLNDTIDLRASGFNVNSSVYSNSTTWWSSVSSWLSGWFVNNGGVLEFNETKLNETIDARAGGDNESWNESYADTKYLQSYTEIDPLWSDNFTKYNATWSSTYNSTYNSYNSSGLIINWSGDYLTLSELLNFNYYNSTDFNISNYLLISNWNATNESYYLKSNPFDFYNSTTLPSSTETDPLWSVNFTKYNATWSSTYNSTYNAYNSTGLIINWSGDYLTLSELLNFNYYNSTDFNISNYLLISNWNVTNESYYLKSNPFDFYNSTTLPSSTETDPLWSVNFTKYNATWSSTYNATYNNWAYNQTTPAINKILSFSYYNSTTLPSSTEIDPYWSDNFTKYNSTWSSTYNATYNNWAYNQTTPAINKILSFSYYNSTNLVIGDYYLKSNPFGFWNDTYATFNETYADTKYLQNGTSAWFTEVNSTGNITAEEIHLEQDPTNHRIYDNSTCVIIRGDTSTMYIC